MFIINTLGGVFLVFNVVIIPFVLLSPCRPFEFDGNKQ